MVDTQIHLENLHTLEEYRAKLQTWKEHLYAIKAEMFSYHRMLEHDKRWFGRLHDEFGERMEQIYNRHLQPAAEALDEGQDLLRDLKRRAEELGVK